MIERLPILLFSIFSTYNKEDYIHPDLQSNQAPVMGNSKSDVDFAINLDKNFYFSSQQVRGHLFVNAKKRYPSARIIIEVEGIESCQFTTVNRQPAKGYKRLIKTSFVLGEFGHNQYLQGQLDFPFSFRFLQYLPGSYEENKQYKAKVSYSLKAIIFSKRVKDQKQETLQKTIEVIIREPQRQGERMLSGQTYALCRNCFCLNRGVSRIYCYFEKNYYFPGDECIMICEADNTKCGMAISRIKCQFMKEVTLTASNGNTRVFTELLNTVFFPGVGANRSYFGENAKRQILKLIHRDSQRSVTPSTNGHFVRCRYYILVQPMFGGWFGRVSDSQFKVYLTILQPAIQYEPIQKPQDWRPSVNQTSSFYLNPDGQ